MLLRTLEFTAEITPKVTEITQDTPESPVFPQGSRNDERTLILENQQAEWRMF
jgi:hypothetical protein